MIDDVATIAAEMSRWEDEDRASEQICVRCHDNVHTPADLEPTPLCNLCAQYVAGLVPTMFAELSSLQASVVAALSSAGPEVAEDERSG